MRPAIFLDRDGVINHNVVRSGRPYSPETLEDFVILPGVPRAVEALRRAGYLIIVVTNQPDVGAGKQSRELVEAMHDVVRRKLAVDDIEVCYHVDSDQCACRKPKPGMLLRAADKHGIALLQSFMVGDRWRDVDAGRAAGCRTVFVDYGYENEPRPERPDLIVRSLPEAVSFMLGETEASSRDVGTGSPSENGIK
jgi:D-glycero-D-manno-heptose 1,7-bisphosphate phosphatase